MVFYHPEGSGFLRNKGAIVFLLNADFLPGLRVFAYSAKAAFKAADEDVLVITDDENVRQDEFVRYLADRIIFIGDEDKGAFSGVKYDKVHKSIKRDDIAAYWFLKFTMFRNFGYDYHIFVDTDLVCLRDDFRFSDIPARYDFIAGPTVGPVALQISSWKDRPTDDAKLDDVERRIRRIAKSNYKLSRSINSGVVRISRGLLGDGIVNGLIALASSKSFRMEQEVVQEYVQGCGASFKSLPIWFNFPVLPAVVLGEQRFSRIAPMVRILHYNRRPKPWQSNDPDYLDKRWLGVQARR